MPSWPAGRVRFLAHFHQRCIEGSAAQIVHQNHAVYFGFVAEFDARGRRLVQQPHHFAPRRAKRLHGQEALVGIGVGRDAQHHFEFFLRQQIAQRRGHFAQHLNKRHLLIGQLQYGVRPGILQHAFERPDDGPLRILLARPSLPAVQPLVAAHRNQGRKPVHLRAVRAFKRKQRIVSAIHRGDNGAGGAKIDSQSHRLTRF